MNSYKHIAIEGNIGAGKTTFSEMLATDLNATLLLEQFQENPFLEKFYQDKERYAFQVELFFLADRYQQIKDRTTADLFSEITIADYIFEKCFIFARNNLQNLEFKLYMHLFEIMKNQMPHPDLIIYLDSSTERLLQNISKRGRDFEKNITAAYLEEIRESYLNHFKQSFNKKVVVVNTEKLDFVNNRKHFMAIKEIINQDIPLGVSFYEV